MLLLLLLFILFIGVQNESHLLTDWKQKCGLHLGNELLSNIMYALRHITWFKMNN